MGEKSQRGSGESINRLCRCSKTTKFFIRRHMVGGCATLGASALCIRMGLWSGLSIVHKICRCAYTYALESSPRRTNGKFATGVTTKAFIRDAEICPLCGAVESFRKGNAGTSVRKENGDRYTYVICKRCGARAVRIVRAPRPENQSPRQ